MRTNWMRRIRRLDRNLSILPLALVLAFGGMLQACTPPSATEPKTQVASAPSTADLERKAALGDASAQTAIGRAYATGEGVIKNYKTALDCFQKAANQGDTESQINLGAMYATGQGTPESTEMALHWWQVAASQGDTRAVAALKIEFEEVLKAEQTGDADFQNTLGFMYDNGHGVAQNHKTAVEWYRRAAEQGNAPAQFNLGVMDNDGQGVAQNYKTAVEWYRKAAAQG